MSYFEQQEREEMERIREEDLVNQQMMYDELMEQKEGLEESCIKIKKQIEDNKELIELQKTPLQSYCSELQPKNKDWHNKAQYALRIKELQIKKINRKVERIKRNLAADKRNANKINDAIRAKLIEYMGEEEFKSFIEKQKEETV